MSHYEGFDAVFRNRSQSTKKKTPIRPSEIISYNQPYISILIHEPQSKNKEKELSNYKSERSGRIQGTAE